MVYQLDDEIWFPDPALADDDGLLAIGGDLRPKRLLLAYQHGIFPWFSDETPILWYSPHKRFVLFPEKIKISKTMRSIFRSGRFTVTFNQAFAEVIAACAAIKRNDQQGTWITAEMQEAYITLHQLGYAHSVEVWENGLLAGGLYGVEINRVFCGESMFSQTANTSKAALIWLCQHAAGYRMIDCQFHTQHLESMGGEYIDRGEYQRVLSEA